MQEFFRKMMAFRAVRSLSIITIIVTLSACVASPEHLYKKYNMSQSDIQQLEAIDAEIAKRNNAISANSSNADIDYQLHEIDKLNLQTHQIVEKYNMKEMWSPMTSAARKQTTQRVAKTEKGIAEARQRRKLAEMEKQKREKERLEKIRLAKIEKQRRKKERQEKIRLAKKQKLAQRNQTKKKSGGTDWGEIIFSGLAIAAGVGAITYGAAKLRGDSARSGRNLQRFECKQKCIKEANDDMEKECNNPSSEFIETLKKSGSTVATSCSARSGEATQNVFKNQCHNYCYN